MMLAGYSTGKYTGGHVVTVVGTASEPADNVAAIVNTTLQDLGFKTRYLLVDAPVMIEKFCGMPSREVDVCPSVGWVRDWSDPQTILDPIFAGYNIQPDGSSNTGQVSLEDAPRVHKAGQPLTALDQAIKSSETTSGEAARARAWAGVDDKLVSDAVAIPWMFGKQPMIESRDVRGVPDLWDQGGWDYAYTSVS